MTESGDLYLDVAAGQTVFREGDPGSEMYIIEQGSIEILRVGHGKKPLAVLSIGDFFGEMAVLEDQPRFATAMATEPTRLLRIDRAAFSDVLASNMEVAVRIMRKLTMRLRRAEQRAADAQSALDGFRDKVQGRAVPAEAAPAEVRMEKVAVRRDPAEAAPKRVKELTTPVPPAKTQAAAVVPVGGAVLVLVHASGEKFVLDGHSEFLVGRPDPVTGTTPEVNLLAVDVQRSLSRRHAKLIRIGDAYSVREEVGTLNGTWVNSERAKPGQALPIKAGDTLRFGTVELGVQSA